MIMAVVLIHPSLSLYLFFMFLIISALPLSQCQYGSPQNIETFYPFEAPSPSPAPAPADPPSTPWGVSQQTPPPKSSKNNNNKIVIAVAGTAACTLVLSGLLFFFIRRCVATRRGGGTDLTASKEDQPAVQPNVPPRFDGNLKEFVVDENGLDVLYWKKLEGKNSTKSLRKEELLNPKKEEDEKKDVHQDSRGKSDQPMQEVPLLQGKSSTQQSTTPPPPLPPPVSSSLAISGSAPPPPPPTPVNKINTPTPPPPPKAGSSISSSKLPPAPPKGMPSDNKPGEPSSGNVKMKPLHWDKVNTNTNHSMVWDKIDGGSFRFDGDLMEHLFGYVATNRLSPQRYNLKDGGNPNFDSPAQIFILEPRRSQNIAIVLKSLAISLEVILDAVTEGQGLDADALERLTKAAPTDDEQSQILQFDGDPTRLATAESFLYHLLKAVPSAFTRFNAMLFRLNYDSEILYLKESIQTLELGCNELRTRGLFMKLLEAILKAGNRMNAGTARGNAQAFNLNALRKLSDVKSTDGKTTLLHFVVEEVVRFEGKKCVMNRNHSLKRSSSGSSSSNNSSNHESVKAKEVREREYKMHGLPIVGGLSAEFSNVKKAATVDYDTFAGMISALTTRAAEIRALVSQCANDRGGGFAREMKGFLEETEEELKGLGEEETRVMELVKRTTEYYQAGASKHKGTFPLQLFVIVKDFLGMVDQACVEIARNLQRRKTATSTTLGSSSPKSPPSKIAAKFPNLPEYFMSDKSRSSSSESDDL